jgi:GT2 family glycosyltransferase
MTVPLRDGRCTAGEVAQAILARFEDAILRHRLAQALATTGLEAAGGLFDLAPGPDDAILPSLTIAVCTRDRLDDLARCLDALGRVDYPNLEVLVVDNSTDMSARHLVESVHPGVRYSAEPCPGLNWARRRAVDESRGDLLAFIDDDVVVDRGWARAVGRVFGADEGVAAVTGLVMPLELAHRPQRIFERAGGMGRGFQRRWFQRRQDELTSPRFANTSVCGVGAAMAFRRAFVVRAGSFDPALGAGTPTGGGDDLDFFFRVLKSGRALVYEPAASARHRHRASMAALTAQAEHWCSGMLAYLERTGHAYADESPALLRLARRLVALYYPRRVLQSVVDPGLPLALALAEWRGARTGRARYARSVQRARELAREYHRPFEVSTTPASEPAGVRKIQPRVWRLQVALDRPVSPVFPNPDRSDLAEATVTWRGKTVTTIRLVTGGYALSRPRLVDAIATSALTELIGDAHVWRRELRTRLGA